MTVHGLNGHRTRTVRCRATDLIGESSTESLTADQFDFVLPQDRIAQRPIYNRTGSRLLVLEDGDPGLREIQFAQLRQVLRPGDLLVCNDSKVIAARLEGRKPTGGRVEILIERILGRNCVWAQMRSSRPCRIGTSVVVADEYPLTVKGRIRDLFVLCTEHRFDFFSIIERFGKIPLPPYIERCAEVQDVSRYQTVYARSAGSVAAPTAGLHFDEAMIEELRGAGIQITFITLHVGAGTFAPVRQTQLSDHTLHSERYEISETASEAIRTTQGEGGRVIAVGTTSMRVLETAAAINDTIRPCAGETNIFIKPGFRFRVTQALITNFHLPRSTLMMLVCAFGGTERTMNAYRHAIDNEFRFYSYGDAMFIQPQRQVTDIGAMTGESIDSA